MALIVETGAALPNSNAFVSVANADAYHSLRGNTAWASGTLGDKEAAIVRATSYLSKGIIWKGYRVKGRLQALAWPRSGVEDCDGYGIPIDVVPYEVQDATSELALLELATPGIMTPVVSMGGSVSTGGRITSETVGAISVSYDLATTASAFVPVVPIVDNLLACLVAGIAGSKAGLWGEIVRV